MAIEKQEYAWLKQEQFLKNKLSKDKIDNSKQLSLTENKSSINSAVIDAPANSLHLIAFNAPKILHLWVKPKVQIGKRNNMDINFLWE